MCGRTLTDKEKTLLPGVSVCASVRVMFVYVYSCLAGVRHTCSCTCTFVCLQKARLKSRVMLNCSISYSLRWGISIEPRARWYGWSRYLACICMGSGDQRPAPWACTWLIVSPCPELVYFQAGVQAPQPWQNAVRQLWAWAGRSRACSLGPGHSIFVTAVSRLWGQQTCLLEGKHLSRASFLCFAFWYQEQLRKSDSLILHKLFWSDNLKVYVGRNQIFRCNGFN